MSSAPVIPEQLSPMEQLYMKLSLDKDGRTNHWGEPGIGEQAHHLRIASALTAAELVEDFLKSVAHYAGYEYDQPFYPRDRNPLTEDKHRPRKDTDLKTSSIAWWLERYDGELRDASQSSLGIRVRGARTRSASNCRPGEGDVATVTPFPPT